MMLVARFLAQRSASGKRIFPLQKQPVTSSLSPTAIRAPLLVPSISRSPISTIESVSSLLMPRRFLMSNGFQHPRQGPNSLFSWTGRTTALFDPCSFSPSCWGKRYGTGSERGSKVVSVEDEEEFLAAAWSRTHIMNPLIRAVRRLGYREPTKIQKQAIDKAIAGSNVIASSENGSGKTAAFSLPMLHRLHLRLVEEKKLKVKRLRKPAVLVLEPSGAMVEQTAKQIRGYASELSTSPVVCALHGDRDEALDKIVDYDDVDILVSTPGALLPLMGIPTEHEENELRRHAKLTVSKNKKSKALHQPNIPQALKKDMHASLDEEENEEILMEEQTKRSEVELDKVTCFIVDECDRMLGLGFFADILRIFRALPRPAKHTRPVDERIQTLLFSATLVPQVHDFTRRMAPSHVLLDLNENMELPKSLEHIVYDVSGRRKMALLLYLLRRRGSLKDTQLLVFCRTRQRCDAVFERLCDEGFATDVVHRDRTPTQRAQALLKFEKGEVQVLVATDMLARGIDIPGLPAVLHYDIPPDSEEFVHRCGRTARAGRSGKSYCFVSKHARVLKVGGRWVSIDEKQFMKEHEKFLHKKLYSRKVAGPWRDEEISVDEDLDLQRHARLADQAARNLMDQKSAELRKTHSDWFYSLSKGGKQTARKHAKRYAASNRGGPTPPLRNFADGRYEDQIKRIQQAQARKKGVILPEDRKSKVRRKAARANQAHKLKTEFQRSKKPYERY